jgi:adenylate kinase family enzyme
MRRVMVIGCGGAGKSTLARRLGDKLALPVIVLDAVYWRPGWVECPQREFREAVARLAATPEWVMDGNYSLTYDLRMPIADAVVWLDLPRWTCMRRVLLRTACGYGRTRDSMTPGCPERFDMDFLRYVWDFHARYRPQIVAALEEFAGRARLYRLESRKESEQFLAMIERS